MVVTNPRRPDNPLELVNRAFVDLTGYTESEIVGRKLPFPQRQRGRRSQPRKLFEPPSAPPGPRSWTS